MKRYLIAAGITLLIVLGLYRWGYHNGWSTRDAEMQAEIAKANEEARQKEQAMTSRLNATATQLQEANDAINKKQFDLDRAIRAGRVRLPAPSCVQASADSPAPAGDRDEAPSESDRQTLAAIAALVAEGQRNTQQLNACIDAYNQVMEQINGSNR